jgi:galactonate dehydratase
MASIHVDACTPASTIQESAKTNQKWTTDLFEGGGVVVKAGFAELPTRPGLGVTLNEKIAAQHPYEPVNRQNFVFSDGGVADH